MKGCGWWRVLSTVKRCVSVELSRYIFFFFSWDLPLSLSWWKGVLSLYVYLAFSVSVSFSACLPAGLSVLGINKDTYTNKQPGVTDGCDLVSWRGCGERTVYICCFLGHLNSLYKNNNNNCVPHAFDSSTLVGSLPFLYLPRSPRFLRGGTQR